MRRILVTVLSFMVAGFASASELVPLELPPRTVELGSGPGSVTVTCGANTADGGLEATVTCDGGEIVTVRLDATGITTESSVVPSPDYLAKAYVTLKVPEVGSPVFPFIVRGFGGVSVFPTLVDAGAPSLLLPKGPAVKTGFSLSRLHQRCQPSAPVSVFLDRYPPDDACAGWSLLLAGETHQLEIQAKSQWGVVPSAEFLTLANYGENDGIDPEDFDALVADVEALTARVDALEDSDDTQAGDIEGLKADLAQLQARVAAVEALPGIVNKLKNQLDELQGD